jgi:hypothetical protein
MSFAILALLLAMPAVASATTLSLAGGSTDLNMNPGETRNVNLMLSNITSNYTDSLLRITINGGTLPVDGNGHYIDLGLPVITAIFGVANGPIPAGNFAGSIWANGSSHLDGLPSGLGPGGLLAEAGLETPSFIPQQTAGLYAPVTIRVPLNAPYGSHLFDFAGSLLINGLNVDFDPVIVQMNAVNFTVTVVPEPSTYALAPIGVAALFAVKRRRR